MSPNKDTKFIFYIFTALFCVVSILPAAANAQGKRDHLTEAEVELVRDAQAIDQRTEIFVKAIDRRLLSINNQAAPDDKKPKKESEVWDEPPAGTRLELFTDIKKILDEAISNIDDAAARGGTDGKPFPKAVRKLSEAARRYLPQLKSALDQTADEKEKGVILSSIDFCEQIVEASAKVPEEARDGKKKKDA